MRGLTEGYLRFELNSGDAFVEEKAISLLKRADAAIFDCDGVLIDIRGSYHRAISKTVAYILERLTGCPFHDNIITDDVIFSFKKTGGFNNDWDLSYAVLMFILCNLPLKFRERLKGCLVREIWRNDPFERLNSVRYTVKKKFGSEKIDLKDAVNSLIASLKDFARKLDETGIASVDKFFRGSDDSVRDFYNSLKKFISYPSNVGEGIVNTVFEEFFCGSELFKEEFGIEPRFYEGTGLIENGYVIIKPETFKRLRFVFGNPKFGIASGSMSKSAEYNLGEITKWFKSEAVVFFEDIKEAEIKTFRKTGVKVNLLKPDPFSLFEAARGLEPFNSALYIGDSMEDLLMVEKARSKDPRFFFVGVYLHSGFEDVVLSDFLKAGADIILPSVNELPFILEEIRRG